MRWIGQISANPFPTMLDALDDAKVIGAVAAYLHGGYADRFYAEQDASELEKWIAHAKSIGLPIGVAGHEPLAAQVVVNMQDLHSDIVVFSRSEPAIVQLERLVPAGCCCQQIDESTALFCTITDSCCLFLFSAVDFPSRTQLV